MKKFLFCALVLALGAAAVPALAARPAPAPLPQGVSGGEACDANDTVVVWPPNNKFKTVQMPTASGLSAVTPTVKQDEVVKVGPRDKKSPDARTLQDGTLQIRAERLGSGDGRFYHLQATFIDADGNETTCERLVVIPHDRSRRKTPVDQGALYDSFTG